MSRFRYLLALVLVVAACAAPEDAGQETEATDTGEPEEATAAEETETAAEGEPILIGVNIEQSGPASVQGEAYARAVELFAEQVNAEGGVLGRPLELAIVDNGTDQTQAVTQTQALIGQGVVAMVGPGTSPTTLAAMEQIISSGIPVVSMGSADNITDPAAERPNVFKTPARASLMAEEILADATADEISRVGLIAVNNPYGDAGVSAWEGFAADGEVELVGVERFEAADTDMTAQLNNLVNAGAEALVVWAIPPGAPTVRRNAVQNLGLDVPMYFDAGAGAELFIELAGDSAEGAQVIHPKTLIWDEVGEDDPQAEALASFGEAYTSEYGAISGFAGYAWDALGLLTAAMEEAGGTEPDAVIEALEGLGEYVGVTGTFEITGEDHQGLAEGDLEMLTVTEGDWTLPDG